MLFYQRLSVIITLVIFVVITGCAKKPEAPRPEVVATYVGGEVTKQELRSYINDYAQKSSNHDVCDKHGWKHDKCEKDEACESHPLSSVDAYRMLTKTFILNKMIERWVKEKGVARRKTVKHGLKHLADDINLDTIVAKKHEDKLEPDRIEIQQYYEEHRDEYQGQAFDEVEGEIKGILAARNQETFIPEYIEQLKKNAVVSKNYDLLKVEAPAERELRNYYGTHREEFIEPLKIKISQIQVNIGGRGSEKEAIEKAQKAMAQLRSGEKFEKVASEYSDGFNAQNGGRVPGYIKKGDRSNVFEENVFSLFPKEMSKVFKEGQSYYIVKLTERQKDRQKALAEVMAEVKTSVIEEKQKKKWELNKFEALFSMHGKRFTVEEFMEEWEEFSPGQRRQFTSFKAKENLLDQMLVKELMLEDVEDELVDSENKKELSQMKNRILSQILHKEEVDEKIEITDDAARELYEKYKYELREPAKAKISLVRISKGFSDDEQDSARKKIDEAEAKLTSGEDFAKVAQEYSEDWTASQGGRLDQWIYEGASYLGEALEHGLHRYIFRLDRGEVSDVFKFKDDFFIVRMDEKQEPRQQTFEEAKPYVKEMLSSVRHEERAYELQNELLEKSKLVVYDHVLSAMLREEKEHHKKFDEKPERRTHGFF